MKNIILFIILLFLLDNNSFAQKETDLKKDIETFFEAMQQNDTSKLKQIMHPNCQLYTIYRKKGKTAVNEEKLNDFVKMISTPLPEKWQEKILTYRFEHDELMSTVFTDYEFIYGGKLSHTGVNQFTFIYDFSDTLQPFKILSIIDTRYFQADGDTSFSKHSEIEEKKIDQILNDWHKDAAKADEKNYFSKMSDSSIYKGTDKTERWTKKEFQKFAHPYFEKGKAWDFNPIERHVEIGEHLDIAWFDEKLETWMGICKGSGIMIKEDGQWKIAFYDLSVTIDNDKIKSFIELSERKKK